VCRRWLRVLGATTTLPLSSTATQRLADGQETAVSSLLASTRVRTHVLAGRVEANASPLESTATHGPAGAHETPNSGAAARDRWTHARPPRVGFVVIASPPSWPLATHSDGDEHDTEFSGRPSPPGMRVTDHAAAPPVGLVDVTTCRWKPTATHSDTEGHDTASSRSPKPLGSSICVRDQ
jgi:hypothetical protein